MEQSTRTGADVLIISYLQSTDRRLPHDRQYAADAVASPSVYINGVSGTGTACIRPPALVTHSWTAQSRRVCWPEAQRPMTKRTGGRNWVRLTPPSGRDHQRHRVPPHQE